MSPSLDAAAPRASQPRVLCVGGTAFGEWPELAGAIEGTLARSRQSTHEPHAAAPAVAWRVAVQAEAPERAAAGGDDGQRWLVFVESPASALRRALAGMLRDDAEADLPPDAQAATLQAWRTGASRWLRLTQARRRHCLLVDTAEARANPDGLAAVLAGWLGLPVEDLALPPAPAVDPLLQMLATAAVAPDRRAADLHAELLASCQPLPDQPEPAGDAALDASVALLRSVRLAAVEAARPAREAERTQLLMSLHETQLELEQALALAGARGDSLAQAQASLTASHASLTQEAARHAAALAQLAAVQDEAALLVAQLHQAQEELESTCARAAESDTVVAALRTDIDRLQHDLATARAEAGLQAKAHAQDQATLTLARQESDLLLTQLHRVQEQLESACARAAESDTVVAALRTDIDRLQHDLATARTEAGLQAKVHAQDQATLALARQESDLLLTQLHRVQEELESLLLAEQQAGARAAALDSEVARLGAELARARAGAEDDRNVLEQSQAQHQAAQAELGQHLAQVQLLRQALADTASRATAAAAEHAQVCEQLNARWEAESSRREQAVQHEARAEVQRVLAELSAARAQAAVAQREAQLLQERVRAAHRSEESLALQLYEALHAAQKPGPEAAPADDSAPTAALRAESVRVVHRRDAAPHRELTFELEQVNVRGHTLPLLTARLVEHEGRPGLALLGTRAGQPQALGQWRPTGHEEGRDLMLLVPRDPVGLERLEHLGTADWRTVLGLARLLEAAVADADPAAGSPWPAVATRLRTQLDSMRPRLRYDRLDVRVHSEAPLALDLQLEEVMHGHRALPPIRVRWQPQAQTDRLQFLLHQPHAALAPLSVWPVQADGTLVPHWTLPLGGDESAGQRLRWWAALPPADRDLVLAVLDVLPGLPDHLPTRAAGSLDPAALHRIAADLRKQARRTAVASRVSASVYQALRRRSANR